MKMKLFALASFLILATSCGKKDEPVVNTAAATTCPAGYVYSPQYTCAPAVNGGTYNGSGSYNGYQPVNNVVIPQYGCGGYGYCGGQHNYNWRWNSHGGYYVYFRMY